MNYLLKLTDRCVGDNQKMNRCIARASRETSKNQPLDNGVAHCLVYGFHPEQLSDERTRNPPRGRLRHRVLLPKSLPLSGKRKRSRSRSPSPLQHQETCDNVENVQNQGPNVQNQGPNVQNQGPHVQNQGLNVQNQGPNVQNQGPHVQNQGLNVQNQGPNVQNQGPNVQNQGPNVQNQGPLYPGIWDLIRNKDDYILKYDVLYHFFEPHEPDCLVYQYNMPGGELEAKLMVEVSPFRKHGGYSLENGLMRDSEQCVQQCIAGLSYGQHKIHGLVIIPDGLKLICVQKLIQPDRYEVLESEFIPWSNSQGICMVLYEIKAFLMEEWGGPWDYMND